MKQLFFTLLCAGFLLAATSAHAYAIYNHASHDVCPKTKFGNCKYFVSAHSTHNGSHGSGLKGVYFQLWRDNNPFLTTTVEADIPDGGFAKVYNDHVEIWRHCNKCDRSKDYLGGYPFEKY
ncbi:MAG: hypothetical protein K9K66_04570 [Desulfarculaceae bacterium]|nr:hypothetical protein [Desulfarculaceae bacterium]MCF8072745.1 hypothetical protein [Desulfarculaceae bacterium]MCF8100913.1 hypothetical protein [Desulfarculaceae bacterium]MCF8118565.1 hypothetical protein [Desulfarculaceae bacterium]